MAKGSTIHKCELQVSDLDRGHYASYSLTLARHPSETDERMMMRLLAFALNASERLTFGKGLSDPDDPDLIERDLTGQTLLWIEVGLPNERAILKACGQSERVMVLAYGHTVDLWWRPLQAKLTRADRLTVLQIGQDESRALTKLAQRSMHLQCTIQESRLWIGADRGSADSVEIVPIVLMPMRE
jgi:uncharacterized protein YaeQ